MFLTLYFLPNSVLLKVSLQKQRQKFPMGTSTWMPYNMLQWEENGFPTTSSSGSDKSCLAFSPLSERVSSYTWQWKEGPSSWRDCPKRLWCPDSYGLQILVSGKSPGHITVLALWPAKLDYFGCVRVCMEVMRATISSVRIRFRIKFVQVSCIVSCYDHWYLTSTCF